MNGGDICFDEMESQISSLSMDTSLNVRELLMNILSQWLNNFQQDQQLFPKLILILVVGISDPISSISQSTIQSLEYLGNQFFQKNSNELQLVDNKSNSDFILEPFEKAPSLQLRSMIKHFLNPILSLLFKELNSWILIIKIRSNIQLQYIIYLSEDSILQFLNLILQFLIPAVIDAEPKIANSVCFSFGFL
jgi:hypothetical protein